MKFSFSNLTNQRISGCNRFVPRLAIANYIRQVPESGHLSAEASFKFSRRPTVAVNYKVDFKNYINYNDIELAYPVDSHPIRASNGIMPFHISDFEYKLFCNGSSNNEVDAEGHPVKTIDLRLEQTSRNYPVLIHGVVFVYKCCII